MKQSPLRESTDANPHFRCSDEVGGKGTPCATGTKLLQAFAVNRPSDRAILEPESMPTFEYQKPKARALLDETRKSKSKR
jgi:hypothetical protein